MRPPRANDYRDAWCGELGATRVGDTVRVAGWVHRRRDHGGLVFIDLRDRSGIVQLVFHPETAAAAHALAERLRSEHVVSAAGQVVRREAFRLAADARRAGLAAQVELGGRSVKGMFKHAGRAGARYVAILGDEGTALKDMESGEQRTVETDTVMHHIRR